MRVFREPCYFAEAVYLLYFFVNQISYEEEYSRISRNYYKRVKEDDEDEARILRRVRELNRVLSVVTAGLDRGDARLRYYFKAMQLPSFKNSCCLAQIMLVTVPLDCSDVEEFAGRLEREYAHMQEIGFKINDLNAMGLVMDIWEEQEKREPLMVQLERLPCSAEERWSILRVLTEYEPHLRELTELKEEREDFTLASAYIITWDSNDWTSSFTINKGSGSGITVDMVAMTAQGEVVGLVTEVGSNWATVTTVLDSALEISANISSSGYAGMVQGAYTTGAEGMLRMDYLPTDAVIRNQEQVVTAGSTLYPRDLILGYVADAGFDETGVAKYALLTPAADFENLEQVFILTHYVHE